MARVLLVADDPSIRDLLRECVSHDLGPVLFAEATEADQALQAMRAAAWDVVLLDLRLPHTNGLVTLRWLKHVRPEVPVVVVTTLPAEPYAGAAARAGAAGFVTREQAPQRVGGMVRALLAARPRMRTHA